jgi:mono/diheme cytochrome c family protein
MRRLIAPALAVGLAAASPALAEGGAGEALYRSGAGAEAALMDGSVRVSAGQFTCAGCHGGDARGRREGGTVFPSLTWSDLTDPTRPGGAYDETLFIRAVTAGIAADGRKLQTAMPRFHASDAVMADLVAYVRSLDASGQTGITASAVLLLAGSDGTDRAGLLAAADWFNGEGGAFGRVLQVVDRGEAAIDMAALRSVLIDRLPNNLPERLREAGAMPGTAQTSADRLGRAATDLPDVALPAFFGAAMLGEAMISCGRNLRRSCLVETLSSMDPERHLPRQ